MRTTQPTRSTPAGHVGEFGLALRYQVPIETVIFWRKRGLLPKGRRRGSSARRIWAVNTLPTKEEIAKAASALLSANYAPVE